MTNAILEPTFTDHNLKIPVYSTIAHIFKFKHATPTKRKIRPET